MLFLDGSGTIGGYRICLAAVAIAKTAALSSVRALSRSML